VGARLAVWAAGGHNQHQVRCGALQKLITSTEGYVGEVPIIHQAVGVKAAIDAMDTACAEDRDASF